MVAILPPVGIVALLAAFAFSVAQGRYGGIQVVGVPADLGAGVTLFTGGGLVGAKYLQAVGAGALTVYLVIMGLGVGRTHGKRAPPREE